VSAEGIAMLDELHQLSSSGSGSASPSNSCAFFLSSMSAELALQYLILLGDGE